MPPVGVVKNNVDAAYLAEKNQGAIGVVIRDDKGQFIAAKCKWYASIQNILTAEAFAARDGAALLNNLNLPKAIMETDNLEVCSLWRTRVENRSTILPVLNEIQELTRRCMFFELVHVKREANTAAHNLARFALLSSSERTWMYEIPECIIPCIQYDCKTDV